MLRLMKLITNKRLKMPSAKLKSKRISRPTTQINSCVVNYSDFGVGAGAGVGGVGVLAVLVFAESVL